MKIKYIKADKEMYFHMPTYGTVNSACFDLYCPVGAKIKPGETKTIPLNIKTEIPQGFCVLLFPRSSMSKFHLIIANGTGVIDSDYRGEWKMKLTNIGKEEVAVFEGDRLIQGMLMPVLKVEFEKAESLSDTERGTGGFGSTGK